MNLKCLQCQYRLDFLKRIGRYANFSFFSNFCQLGPFLDGAPLSPTGDPHNSGCMHLQTEVTHCCVPISLRLRELLEGEQRHREAGVALQYRHALDFGEYRTFCDDDIENVIVREPVFIMMNRSRARALADAARRKAEVLRDALLAGPVVEQEFWASTYGQACLTRDRFLLRYHPMFNHHQHVWRLLGEGTVKERFMALAPALETAPLEDQSVLGPLQVFRARHNIFALEDREENGA